MDRAFENFAAPVADDRSGVTLGGAFTGMLVAVTCSVAAGAWVAAIMDSQGFDLNRALRGSFSLATAGVAIIMFTVLFVSFLWGGYTAGRMGAGSGVVNGVLVAAFAIVAVAVSATIAVRAGGMESFNLPFGIGEVAMDLSFTPAVAGALVATAAAALGGAIWGSVIGVRWHWTTDRG